MLTPFECWRLPKVLAASGQDANEYGAGHRAPVALVQKNLEGEQQMLFNVQSATAKLAQRAATSARV